jgi:hypothetical protein
MAMVIWLEFINCRLFDSLAMKWRKQSRGRRMALKLWDLYYWNKHEYCWKWLDTAQGVDKYGAIRDAKLMYQEYVARGDVMKVEKC